MAEAATILVIEDDAGLARLQQMRLERAGYHVVGAATAAEGLTQALCPAVELIVLDQRLPGGTSGLDVYRQIRAAGRDVPAILVTAFSDEQTVLQALRAGVIDFIPKTADYLDYLVPAIERVLKERRTERQLADSRAQLAGIIESALDAVLTVDDAGRVLVFNPAAEDIFGSAAGAAHGRAVRDFLPDWDELLTRCVPAAGAERGRQVGHLETRGCRADGGEFPVELSLSRRPRLPFWTCIARDLTERKRAQEEHYRLVQEQAARVEAQRAEGRLRQLVDKLQEQAHLLELAHALAHDSEGRIIFWNKGTAQMYGWSDAEALGKNVHALLKTIFPIPRQEIEQQLRRDGIWEGELIHTTKDGTTLVVASHWALHRDADGRPVAVLEINNDVTELKRLQEALRESDRRKDEFLATLAHELRNPLAPIRNALHLMRLTKNNPVTVEQSREMMERQVKHMVRLIDDLLEVSRLSRGKIQIKKEPISVAEIITMAVEGSRPWMDDAGHQLIVNAPEEPITLEVDGVRIAQVLLNLLNNAAKYTEHGGRIWLSAAVERASRRLPGEVVFRVKDTGVGIAPDMLSRIFEMFTQVGRSTDRAQGGLGIGLALVRSLVQLHGGRIEAYSAGPGQGSEFVVRLPLPRAAAPAGAAASGGALTPAATGLHILVVDDNRDGAESLAMLLHEMGHEVEQAYDGLSGLERARREHPQVLLCDIGLPGISGYEVARRLRAESAYNDVLLVALTGWGQEDDRRRSQEAGFDAHLVKPVEHEALAELLAAVRATGTAT